MIEKNLANAMVAQANAEFFSAQLYEAMSNFAHFRKFPGIAHWFHKHAKEERHHAKRFTRHLLDRDFWPILSAIEQPQQDFNSIVDLFEKAYEHEKTVTERINKLDEISDASADYGSRLLMHEISAEQVEEEALFLELLTQFRLIKNDGAGLLDMDQKLGKE